MEVVDNSVEEVGGWDDIVAFCADVSHALDVAGRDNSDFEQWRPKQGEDREDVRGRTVDAETIGETRVEAASDGVRSDLGEAGTEMKGSGAELLDGEPRRSAQKAGKAGEKTATGLGTMLARLVRSLETGIYRHIVEPTNPDYFEGADVSAALYRRGLLNRRYRCRVVFDDADTHAAVVDELEND
ncbi:MAG: DUF5828 family protein [Candidatus Nanohaloarchaea archaeon]